MQRWARCRSWGWGAPKAPCCRRRCVAGQGRLGMPLVPSCQELSRAVPCPWLPRDPASLLPCSLGCSWLGSEGCVWAGKAACHTVAQSLPCPSAGTALLPSCPMPQSSKACGDTPSTGMPPTAGSPGPGSAGAECRDLPALCLGLLFGTEPRRGSHTQSHSCRHPGPPSRSHPAPRPPGSPLPHGQSARIPAMAMKIPEHVC